jgi:hypothetical protein
MACLLVLSLPREVGAVPFGPLSVRFAFFGLIAVVTTVVPGLWNGQVWTYRYLVGVSPGGLWLPVFLSIPGTQALASWLPLVWFYTAAWPSRAPVSRTGLCVTLAISAILLACLMRFEMTSLWTVIRPEPDYVGCGARTREPRHVYIQFRPVLPGLGSRSRAARHDGRDGVPSGTLGMASRPTCSLRGRGVRFVSSPDRGGVDHRA